MASEVVITQQKCANTLTCVKRGTFACPRCYIVMYCSGTCQEKNWNHHVEACHVVILTASFERENRLPIWAPQTIYADLMRKHRNAEPKTAPQIGPPNRRESLEANPRGGQYELFGSYPAIDVLRLPENEGINRKAPLNVLFVEPTDLRDLIKTVVDLPENTSTPINFFVTDCTTERTIRHLILLLMALSSQNPDITAECAIPFWYTPFVPKWCLPAIRELIGPFLQDCGPKNQEEVANLESGILREWSFGCASLTAVLTDHKQEERANLDHYEKTMMSIPPAWRPVRSYYLPSTQVAPFQNHHALANWLLCYNPTLFYSSFWPLKRDADPLRGWTLTEICNHNGTRDAVHDIYGKMFYYVRDLFKRFILKLRTSNITFRVLPYSGQQIPQNICQSFDRIETATLADEDRAGIRAVVNTLSDLLKPTVRNPHATMITLHPGVFDKIQNAIPCPKCDPHRAVHIKQAVDLTTEEKALLDAYLPLWDADPVHWIFTASGWQRREARWLFRDPKLAWDLYKDIYNFQDVAKGARVKMREAHQVVNEWTLRFKHANSLDGHGQPTPEAKWDFDSLFSKQQTAGYRYVEWQRLSRMESRKPRREQKTRTLEIHRKHHEFLSNDDLAELEKKGSQLERWMGKDNCENWTPY
ncbi:hypothetical protein F4801DRAFT_600608 [Xylaria longipes]|nr:hypothetical protein F4801DRAFT_600608 [Xylaria longipes]